MWNKTQFLQRFKLILWPQWSGNDRALIDRYSLEAGIYILHHLYLQTHWCQKYKKYQKETWWISIGDVERCGKITKENCFGQFCRKIYWGRNSPTRSSYSDNNALILRQIQLFEMYIHPCAKGDGCSKSQGEETGINHYSNRDVVWKN